MHRVWYSSVNETQQNNMKLKKEAKKCIQISDKQPAPLRRCRQRTIYKSFDIDCLPFTNG